MKTIRVIFAKVSSVFSLFRFLPPENYKNYFEYAYVTSKKMESTRKLKLYKDV